MHSEHHILYNFRRCPYAMRARMALYRAGISVEVHDIDLKNKPAALLAISPAGTVPVLQLTDGTVLHHSTDIVKWALEASDPDGWLDVDVGDADALITFNDGEFKNALDRYKYPVRFPDEDCSDARERGAMFIETLNTRLTQHKYLCGDRLSYCDTSIFPFIRQFANVDKDWFSALPLPKAQEWLEERLRSPLFEMIMRKNESIYMLQITK